MKRSWPGSDIHRVSEVLNASSHSITSMPSRIEVPPIPVEARKHIEYLSQYPLSHIYHWVSIEQKVKAQRSGAGFPVNCWESQRCGQLLEAEPDASWIMKTEGVSGRSERQHASPSATPRGECTQFQLYTESPQSLLEKCEAPSPMVHQLVRKPRDPGSAIYACSFCDQRFHKKGNWKRHEGGFHEPQKEWQCPESGCNRKFTAGNKLRKHHQSHHGCIRCEHDTDPSVISTTQTASAWGCGFCITLLKTWDHRANHIASHFEAGSKKAEWDISTVILSLLHHPMLFRAWLDLSGNVKSSEEERPLFQWSAESSQGLVRRLQFGRLEEEKEAREIVQLAYSLTLPNKAGPDEADAVSEGQIFPPDNNHIESQTISPDLANTWADATGTSQLPDASVELTVDDIEGLLLPDNPIFGEDFHYTQDCVTPCPEDLEPTAWFFWPNCS